MDEEIKLDMKNIYSEIKLLRNDINDLNEKIDILKRRRKPLLKRRLFLWGEYDKLEQILLKQKGESK
jgi:regulator of replication initiation timing